MVPKAKLKITARPAIRKDGIALSRDISFTPTLR